MRMKPTWIQFRRMLCNEFKMKIEWTWDVCSVVQQYATGTFSGRHKVHLMIAITSCLERKHTSHLISTTGVIVIRTDPSLQLKLEFLCGNNCIAFMGRILPYLVDLANCFCMICFFWKSRDYRLCLCDVLRIKIIVYVVEQKFVVLHF